MLFAFSFIDMELGMDCHYYHMDAHMIRNIATSVKSAVMVRTLMH